MRFANGVGAVKLHLVSGFKIYKKGMIASVDAYALRPNHVDNCPEALARSCRREVEGKPVTVFQQRCYAVASCNGFSAVGGITR